MRRYRISFAGAGKVVSSLIPCMKANGHAIVQIFSRDREKGNVLAKSCGARWSDIPSFDAETDIVLVAVSDSALESVLGSIKCSDGTVVAHTAGSFGLEFFPESIKHCGIFYPLQTFSDGRSIDLKEVPLLYETADRETSVMLRNLAESLGLTPFESDAEHRRLLHVAAVFASNFTNYMITTGERIISRTGFSPDLLKPLILETVNKAMEKGAINSQTGPAIRNDYNTIEKHLNLLTFSPELQMLYEEISRSIINFYKKSRPDE